MTGQSALDGVPDLAKMKKIENASMPWIKLAGSSINELQKRLTGCQAFKAKPFLDKQVSV
jgi:hypothetical protein